MLKAVFIINSQTFQGNFFINVNVKFPANKRSWVRQFSSVDAVKEQTNGCYHAQSKSNRGQYGLMEIVRNLEFKVTVDSMRCKGLVMEDQPHFLSVLGFFRKTFFLSIFGTLMLLVLFKVPCCPDDDDLSVLFTFYFIY